MNQVVYSMGGALHTMVKDILAEIDAEIARLEQAKALLSPNVSPVGQQRSLR